MQKARVMKGTLVAASKIVLEVELERFEHL